VAIAFKSVGLAKQLMHPDQCKNMDLIQDTWPAWLGLEKKKFLIFWDTGQHQRSFWLQYYKLFFVLEMLLRLASAAADATFS
jgi:hypothetical protein